MSVYRSQCLTSTAHPRKMGDFVPILHAWQAERERGNNKSNSATVATAAMNKKSSRLQSIQVIVNYKLSFVLKRALMLTRSVHFFLYRCMYVDTCVRVCHFIHECVDCDTESTSLNFAKFSSFTRFRFMLLSKAHLFINTHPRHTSISHFLSSMKSELAR